MSETSLPADSQEFKLFEDACAGKELVRIRYLRQLPDDPALPEELRKGGLPTIVEGSAVFCNETRIEVAPLYAEEDAAEVAKRPSSRIWSIPRDQVLSIALVGSETEPSFDD